MKDEEPDDLADLLRRLDRAAAVPAPDGSREAALLAAFDAAHASSQAPRRAVRWLAAAAAVAIVAGASAWIPIRRSPAPTAAPPPLTAVAEPMDFVALPGASVLPPLESGELVRMDLPASMLPSLGLFPPASDARVVRADVLIGQDGLPRAVRLLR
jgi:hypothetical protein